MTRVAYRMETTPPVAESPVRLRAARLPSLGVPKDTVARRMKLALAESDLKDKEVAKRAHVTPEWIGSVKQGKTKNPPTDKLRAVARVLGKQTRYFTEPLEYIPIEEEKSALDHLAIIESTILRSDLSERDQEAALRVMRALFKQGKEPPKQ